MVIGEDIIFQEEVGSTNLYLMNRISQERIKEGTLVWTFRQTAGRGLDQNSWESTPGKNLTFSFVLYPSFLCADQQFRLTKAVSLGLIDLVMTKLPIIQEVKIKWPNDIYIGNRKVAGVLIQNGVKGERFEYSVIGIGLNVNQESFSPDIPNPVSLKLITGNEFILETLLANAIECLQSRINLLKSGDNSRLDKDYLDNLYRFGEVHDYIFKGKKIRARISGINYYGQLILEIPGENTIVCDLKEVEFVL